LALMAARFRGGAGSLGERHVAVPVTRPPAGLTQSLSLSGRQRSESPSHRAAEVAAEVALSGSVDGGSPIGGIRVADSGSPGHKRRIWPAAQHGHFGAATSNWNAPCC
jgi:hypothetical protein